METTSLLILLLIAVGVLCYIAWAKRSDSLLETARADLKCADAEINWLRLSQKSQQKKYDDLYDAFLRVNQYNTNLNKRVTELSRSYESVGDEIYSKLLSWKTRKELASEYWVPYTTLCSWIRKKQKEALADVPVISNVSEKPLL